MKIVVFSDSHGNVSDMVEAVEREQPRMVIHLGDCWRDADRLSMAYPQLPLVHVPGNCDFVPGEELEKLVEIEGARIFLCHGHTLGVKQGYGGAISRGRQLGADLVLFGHTHRRCYELNPSGMQTMNPGAMARGGFQSYGVLMIQDGEVRCEHREVSW